MTPGVIVVIVVVAGAAALAAWRWFSRHTDTQVHRINQ